MQVYWESFLFGFVSVFFRGMVFCLFLLPVLFSAQLERFVGFPCEVIFFMASLTYDVVLFNDKFQI